MQGTAAGASCGEAAIPFSFRGRAPLGAAGREVARRGAEGTPAADFPAAVVRLAVEARQGGGDADFIGRKSADFRCDSSSGTENQWRDRLCCGLKFVRLRLRTARLVNVHRAGHALAID